MSRKFIAAVLAASLVVTGFSAAPTRAAEAKDVAKVLGGAALVYMIGKAVSDARAEDRERDRKEKEKKKAQQAAAQELAWRNRDPAPYLPRPYTFEGRPAQAGQPSHGGPQGVLPASCLRDVRGERGQVMQRACLRDAAVRTEALPDRCSKKIRIGKDKERVFSAECLQKAGWRVVGRGAGQGQGRHDDWHGDRHDNRHGDWARGWGHDGRRD
ncbi:hypothetical protein [Salipiger mangrovisoli]|uniref:Uncharacterized protein n=1 Tax=Salipiger mangrovisoli TaxID=2865933 RepID=A0ABR9X6R4_9RHOB|nr:hypothetical protein [Salipiger mangrovisoli]MBE9639298.1 hypothetical protein [Salipiger mangrovisoli]